MCLCLSLFLRLSVSVSLWTDHVIGQEQAGQFCSVQFLQHASCRAAYLHTALVFGAGQGTLQSQQEAAKSWTITEENQNAALVIRLTAVHTPVFFPFISSLFSEVILD